MSSKLEIAKLVVNVITGVGVSKVVHDIIENNTTIETTADAAKVWVGSAVIGSMVAERSSEHVNKKVDDAINWWNNRQKTEAAKAVSE